MTMQRLVAVMTLLLLLAGGAGAQEERSAPDALTYGDVVLGEITDAVPEVFYDFEGRAEDIVVLDLRSTTEDNQFSWPEVILYSSDREVLADSTEFISIDESVVAVELPYTGQYQIMVTRDDVADNPGVGSFELRIVQPQPMRPGDTLAGEVANDAVVQYYSVRYPEVFSVYYEFAGGQLDPHFLAYSVGRSGQLREVAEVNGDGVVSASLGLNGADSDFHIITISDAPFAFYFDDRVERAEYRLRLIVDP